MNCYFQYQSKDYSHVRTSASWRKSYYINSPAKIGIYRQNETDIYLIDSGNDKEAAKKIIKIAAQQNWTIKGIVNTHSNADHIGGNAYLQQQVGCPVFANGIEAAFTQYPILEPSFLYGGYPCKDLRNKFLMAKESQTLPFRTRIFPKSWKSFPCPVIFLIWRDSVLRMILFSGRLYQ